jgi:hypothetical protein
MKTRCAGRPSLSKDKGAARASPVVEPGVARLNVGQGTFGDLEINRATGSLSENSHLMLKRLTVRELSVESRSSGSACKVRSALADISFIAWGLIPRRITSLFCECSIAPFLNREPCFSCASGVV